MSDRVRASCPESPRSKKRGKSETECLALPINGAKMGSFLAGLDQYLRLLAVVGARVLLIVNGARIWRGEPWRSCIWSATFR